MIIDFHTHIFPDQVAKKALPKLSDTIRLEPSTDGTFDGQLSSMEKSGVNLSVVLPVVTEPRQFDSILRFACQINQASYPEEGGRLLSLGGIHPESARYKEELLLLRDYGFKGFKIHPDYQETDFNDIRYKRILDRATELGLFCLTHTGYDPYSPQKIHCTVEMILEVLSEVSPKDLVLAHMGSNAFYDQAEEALTGLPVYLDTAYSILHMEPAKLLEMIQKHGADKILFGTDAPWADPKEAVQVLSNLPGLSWEDKNLIFSENAKRLLHL